MFDILALPAFADNYIWLLKDTAAHQVAVVDPGDAQPVIAWLEAHPDWQLTDILITHHHRDHTGGIAALKHRTGARVAAPANEAIDPVDLPLRDGERLDVLGASFEVLRVPGHTAGHIAFYLAGETPVLFSGDSLFAAGCGRLFEGTPEQMHTSLQRLAQLPDATLVYCGHEYTLSNLTFALAADPKNPEVEHAFAMASRTREQGRPTVPTSLAHERRVNPFLRVANPGIQQVLQAQRGLPSGATEAQAFAALRAWKDVFRG